MIIEMFPEELIELNREVANHPELMHRLANHPPDDIINRIAEIAVYCEVIVDGMYSRQEVLALCDKLTTKLKLKNVLKISSLDILKVVNKPH